MHHQVAEKRGMLAKNAIGLASLKDFDAISN
jgi:hypothetical protein